MQVAGVDFIVQLGDFCWPPPINRPYLQALNASRGPAQHILVNYVMDEGFCAETDRRLLQHAEDAYSLDAGLVRGSFLRRSPFSEAAEPRSMSQCLKRLCAAGRAVLPGPRHEGSPR